MNSDILAAYIEVREEIFAEKRMIEARLRELNDVLRDPAVSEPRNCPRPSIQGPRRNRITLREAVRRVVSDEMKSESEVVAALNEQGYRFDPAAPNERLESILHDFIDSSRMDRPKWI